MQSYHFEYFPDTTRVSFFCYCKIVRKKEFLMSQSEVARLRLQIERECEASWHALHGLTSGMAQHEIISSRLRRIDTYYGQLSMLIGDESATTVICEIFNQSGEAFTTPTGLRPTTNPVNEHASAPAKGRKAISIRENL